MSQFEYVMVLVSIILGLGITHILFGFGALVDRLTGSGPRIRPGIAHTGWLARIFLWMVLFWWWEFRFGSLEPDWSIGLYLFLVGYAILLFLLAVILVPRAWEEVTKLDDFFLQRRVWFYSFLLVVTAVDLLDAYLKGGVEYIAGSGFNTLAYFAVTPVAVVIGIRSRNLRLHAFMAWGFFLNELIIAFDALPRLGF